LNPFATLFFVVIAALLWAVPRKLALVPLLVGCCYMTLGQGIELGPITLPIYRMLLAVGFLRVVVKGERLSGDINFIDKLMIAWAVWYLFASFFHDGSPGSGPIYTLGVIFNQLLLYFLVRVWCRDVNDLTDLIKILGLLFLPVALEMVFEKITGKNLFSVFGGISENVLVREGKLRAQGPFLHPILAGTVGATSVPLFVSILKQHKAFAWIGIVSSLGMVITSTSSGPIMSLLAALFGLMMWRFRHLAKMARICAVIAYFGLMLVMERPPYYLISKIDISGGSTGWHRSYLIEQTFNYLSEWWLFGTDHTRHWMKDQGVGMLPNHTDITNYYIAFGVNGGLPCMLMIILMLLCSFRWVGRLEAAMFADHPENSFKIWCFGCSLFSHAVTSISVAYFDQSVAFFWLNVAVISSMYSTWFLSQESPAWASPQGEGDEDRNIGDAAYRV
jgi:hypothetical protein